jgi:hypothetical protein
VGKGKRADVYLEVRKRRGHIFLICIGTIICILKAYFTFERR